MTTDKKEIRVRFAPSPTGHLHMGNVRVAIFNWLFARHNNAKYLVRVEDTDVQRSTKEFLESQLGSLKWLDLLPDEPIVYQMQRVGEHKKVIQELLDKKLAYPCFCEQQDLELRRAQARELGKIGGYPGTCRGKSYTQQDLQKPHAIRFAIPDDIKFVEFDDAIHGKIKIETDQLDDFVIMRTDGTPTYNLVVVIDDVFMRISHIIRGEDHISNTPKQILIYKALGAQVPIFAHLPMILGPSGNRLSKRDAAVSAREYKQQGFLADAFFNYLVRLGWSHGDQEIFTKDEMIKYFSIDQVGKKGAIFDIKKLEWLNGVYIRELSFEKFLQVLDDLEKDYKKELAACWNQEQQEELFEQYKQRATRLLDMVQDMISLTHEPRVLDLSLIKKWSNENTPKLLSEFLQEVEKLDELTHDNLLEIANQVCNKFDVKLVALAQPLRLALTGKIVSPGVFELISILGKSKSLERIGFLISNLPTV
jgi:glutamyl-tRNA synthetase